MLTNRCCTLAQTGQAAASWSQMCKIFSRKKEPLPVGESTGSEVVWRSGVGPRPHTCTGAQSSLKQRGIELTPETPVGLEHRGPSFRTSLTDIQGCIMGCAQHAKIRSAADAP